MELKQERNMLRATKDVMYEIITEGRIFTVMVKISACYDPGVHTFPNGDPGYPPSEDRDFVIEKAVEIFEDGMQVIVEDADFLRDLVEEKVYSEDINYYL